MGSVQIPHEWCGQMSMLVGSCHTRHCVSGGNGYGMTMG
jgi:hypothetical protein